MARSNAFEEVLRLVIEAGGKDDVELLLKQLGALESVSGNASKEAIELSEKLKALATTAAQIQAYTKLKATISETGVAVAAESEKLVVLKSDLQNAEKPTAAMSKAIEKSEAALAGLLTMQNRQSVELQKTAGALTKAGVDTGHLGAAYNNLRQQVGTTTQALNDYRVRAAAATKSTEGLAAATGESIGLLGKLKGVAETAFGFLSFGAVVEGLKSIFKAGSDTEQQVAQLNAALASTQAAAGFTGAQLLKMAEDAAKSSSFTIEQIIGAQTRLLSFTDIVGNRFPQALQAALNLSARLGLDIETSAKLVGKALETPTKAMETLGRQGFKLSAEQKDLIAQLEATGHTAEAQTIVLNKLAESFGGADMASRVGTFAGLLKGAHDSIRDFMVSIADSGVFEAFKRQLSEMLDSANRLARDGSLARYAKSISDALIAMGAAVRDTTVFLFEHRGALIELGRAYLALKIAKWVVELNVLRETWLANAKAALSMAGALETTATKGERLRGVFKSLPANIKIGVALIGFDLAIQAGKKLGEVLGENSAAAANAAAVSERVREQLRAEAVQRATVAVGLERYRDETILTSEQLSKASETEREAYRVRLEGLREYTSARVGYLLRMQQIGAATAEERDELDKLEATQPQIREGFNAIAEGARLATEALTAHLSPAAQALVEKLKGVETDAKFAASSIKEMFDNLNFAKGSQLGDVALALAHIASQGASADRNIRDGLVATLHQLSGQDLLRFQSAATAAFGGFKTGAQAATAILDSTLLAAMTKLGISAEHLGVQFTDSGKDATAAFSTVLENANATADQIVTAFKAALGKVSTQEEARDLGILLEQAGEQGKIGFDQASRSAADLRGRLQDIRNDLDPLADEFKQLGIKSQAELNTTRDKAKDAFEAIAAGKRPIEDVRRAFVAYAEAERAAAAESQPWKREQIESQLAVKASILGVTESLERMGNAGEGAGENIAQGAEVADNALKGLRNTVQHVSTGNDHLSGSVQQTGENLGGLKGAADGAAGAVDDLGYAIGSAEDFMSNGGKKALQLTAALGDVSQAAADAYRYANKFVEFQDIWREQINRTTAEWRRQEKAVNDLNKALDDKLQKADPLAEKIKALRAQYNYVPDAQLRSVAEKQQRVQDEAKRAEEERQRAAHEELARATQAYASVSGASGAAADSGSHPLFNPNLATSAHGGVQTSRHHYTFDINVPPGANLGGDQVRHLLDQMLAQLRRDIEVSLRH